ncbi:MAG: tyrosine-type recombinase/integrase [Rhodospirillaceae bacterium]|nr:tyrosine-type recombinase/integrase [Rhodospirillaceae bacterium]
MKSENESENREYEPPLTAAYVKSAKALPNTEGKITTTKYYDGPGSGLYLRVTPTGYKYWETRVTVNGRRRTRGLGPYPMVSLKEARAKAQELRVRVRNGEDPFGTRGVRELTFAEAAAHAIADRQSRWSNPDERKKDWLRVLERYAYPKIGRSPMSAITIHDVIDVLRGVEKSFPRSLPLVHQRMGVVFKWSRTNGHCTDNPVADVVLKDIFGAAPSVRHHPALPHAQVAGAMALVRESEVWLGNRLLFLFLVLTAVRTNEARGATWAEIDFEATRWTVPAARMKSGAEHSVPLSTAALSVLREARDAETLRAAREGSGISEVVFPSQNGRVLYNNALSNLAKSLGIAAVPHGFRSSFRDWCGETGVEFVVAEKCLAHEAGNDVVTAYSRSDLYTRRIPVMEGWGQYVLPGSHDAAR